MNIVFQRRHYPQMGELRMFVQAEVTFGLFISVDSTVYKGKRCLALESYLIL